MIRFLLLLLRAALVFVVFGLLILGWFKLVFYPCGLSCAPADVRMWFGILWLTFSMFGVFLFVDFPDNKGGAA